MKSGLTFVIALVILFAGFILLLNTVASFDRATVRRGAMKKHEVVLIDDCEYILVVGHNRVAVTHKGNCRNH